MAGGSGTRFWPKSTVNFPKQFLSLTNDGKTMIQHTVERLSPLINCRDIFVITNEQYKSICYKQLVENAVYAIPAENIICEPVARNTAPAIGLAAMYTKKRYGDAVMVLLPSDHFISNIEKYQENIVTAVRYAQKDDNLVTIGIRPSYPETGYGYIQIDAKKNDFRVCRFVEKPDLTTAKKLLASGDYLWNSGQFIWKASTIFKKIQQFEPELYTQLENILPFLDSPNEREIILNIFPSCKSISIDCAVMERSEKIFVIPADFCWDDVGSWLALDRIKSKDENHNVVDGKTALHQTKNCIIQGNKKIIACVGLENLIIVDTDEALLICHKDNAQDVKKIQELVRENN